MINVAMLLGRVGKKDTKTLKNGGDITVISVATNKKYKDSTGATQEQTTWHNVSCFSKLSEIASKYVHVGDMVFIQGSINNKKIESGDKAGQYVYSIHATDIKFIPKGAKSSESEKDKSVKKLDDDLDFMDGDIPF